MDSNSADQTGDAGQPSAGKKPFQNREGEAPAEPQPNVEDSLRESRRDSRSESTTMKTARREPRPPDLAGSETSKAHLEAAVERRVPFLDLLGIRAVDADDGRAVFEMIVEERHLRTRCLLHGGVAATLLDTAMGFAAVTTSPEGHYAVTIQMNMNFTRPAREGDRLIATGEVRHRGRQTVVAFGELHTAAGVLVASGTATFMYVPEA